MKGFKKSQKTVMPWKGLPWLSLQRRQLPPQPGQWQQQQYHIARAQACRRNAAEAASL